MESEFVNKFNAIAIRQQLLRLHQKKNESLAEYTRRFEALSKQIKDYSDEQLVMMFTDWMSTTTCCGNGKGSGC